MSMNDYQLTWQHCEDECRGGELCKGDECRGWFLDQCDCWHACSCQVTRNQPHPEHDDRTAEEWERDCR